MVLKFSWDLLTQVVRLLHLVLDMVHSQLTLLMAVLMIVIHLTCMTHGVMDGTEVHTLFLMAGTIGSGGLLSGAADQTTGE